MRNLPIKFLMLLSVGVLFQSCVSTYVRLPNSASQVYGNPDVQQSLMLVAQNNVMIHIPEGTTREFEKSEIDQNCRQIQDPLWAEKLSVYLNEFRKRPELLSKFHVIEMKRADKAGVVVQRDLDGAVTVSIQFMKLESYGKVEFQTKLPCKTSVAEYLGRDIIRTTYEFPEMDKLVLTIQQLAEKPKIPRFGFNNEFLVYLAERGTILKFAHELSFEKTVEGKYILVEMLNKLAGEIKKPLHQHVNYWLKQINERSKQAGLIQMFSITPDKELKVGVKVETRGEVSQKLLGDSDLTYLFMTYNVENELIKDTTLDQLEGCLKKFTEDMSGLKLRKPAASDRESYLKPGYFCEGPKI